MRFGYFLILLITVFLACNNDLKKKENAANHLNYELSPVKTNSILVRGQVTGNIDTNKLKLNLVLNNLLNKKLHIKEIYISTEDQIKSVLPINNQNIYSLAANQDTSFSLVFYPVNDKILYQNTDLRGILKSSYTISIVYTIEGDKRTRILDLFAAVQDADYQEYKKSQQFRLQAFHINTATQFTTRLTKYLNKQKLTKNPVFVHLSDQEIAVSGLNFRLKSFQKNDSLYATISIINHSGFSIKIDTNKLDFKSWETVNKNHKQIVLEKVTGSKDDYEIIRKGDRMIVSLKKHQKDRVESAFSLALKNSFLLPNGKSLFLDDLELVQVPSSEN